MHHTSVCSLCVSQVGYHIYPSWTILFSFLSWPILNAASVFWQRIVHKDICLYILLDTLLFIIFQFKSIIHLKLSFVYSMRQRLRLIFCSTQIASSSSTIYFLKRYNFKSGKIKNSLCHLFSVLTSNFYLSTGCFDICINFQHDLIHKVK